MAGKSTYSAQIEVEVDSAAKSRATGRRSSGVEAMGVLLEDMRQNGVSTGKKKIVLSRWKGNAQEGRAIYSVLMAKAIMQDEPERFNKI